MDERSSRDPIRERSRARLGQTILGKFRLDSLLGVGGMASVYAATHRNGNRVALKILHEHVSMDPDVRRLFRREGLAANKVDHPGVVRILDDDVTADGCGFLVMPLLVGETLQARLERLGRRLPMRDALVVGHAVLDILAAAHTVGVVHRDIKPENIFIAATGDVHVLDFGVARLLETAMEGAAVTRAGQAIGTPAFMPPEQALGRTGEIDAQSDLWSVGATLFLCLSGEYAHGAETTSELLVYAATRPARPLQQVLPDVNLLLAQVVDRALAFEKKDRWADAAAMKGALDGVYTFALAEPVPVPPRLEAPPPDVLRHLEQRVLEGVDPFAATSAEASGGALGSGRSSGATKVEAPAITADMRKASGATWGKRGRTALAAGVLTTAGVVIAAAVGVARKGESSKRIAADAEAVTPATPARAAYEEALRAWRDGSGEQSKRAMAKASGLDPTMGAPDLLWVVEGFQQPSEHFKSAWQHRASLSPEELAVLDALEPNMRVPPAPEEARSRLASACQHYPTSTECAFSLANVETALQLSEEAEAKFDGILSRDPGFAPAWIGKARSRLHANDVHGAMVAYRSCLKASPYSTNCSTALAGLDSAEGNCVEMEAVARQMISATPNTPTAYVLLGQAILGRGGAVESAREVFAQGRNVSVDPVYKARDEASRELSLNLFEGQFDAALKRVDALKAQLSGATDEPSHAELAGLEMTIDIELGDRAQTTRVASEFLKRREAWAPDGIFDYGILSYVGLYLSGAWNHTTFRAKQQEWLDAAKARHLRGPADATWVMGIAQAAKTRSEAEDALRSAPSDPANISRNAATPSVDEAIGNAFLLADRLKEAEAFLATATRRCTDSEPIEMTRAQLRLGETREKLGDVKQACAAYAIVVARWGREPRSVSAARAREHAAALGCPRAAPPE